MWFVCGSECIRDLLLAVLHDTFLPEDHLFYTFPVLPKLGHVVIAFANASDANIRAAVRHFIMNGDGWSKLVLVPTVWSDELVQEIELVVRQEQSNVNNCLDTWHQKAMTLPNCTWKSDRLSQLSRWKEASALEYSILPMNDSLSDSLNSILSIPVSFEIDGDLHDIKSKPPALHWTASPLEGEQQIILRFNFPFGGLDQHTFRELCRDLTTRVNQSYLWKSGVLLTFELVRVHVERINSKQIEITGRICVDELEDDQIDKSFSYVWPLLVSALKQTLAAVCQQRYLVHSIDLVLFGAFFEPPYVARVFDLTTFMATACAYHKVGCRIREELHDVDVKLLFPDGPFESLATMLSLEVPHIQALPLQTSQEKQVDNLALFNGLTVTHNRGRRVSFGGTRMIDNSDADSDTTATSQNGELETYVDELLRKSMDLRLIYQSEA